MSGTLTTYEEYALAAAAKKQRALVEPHATKAARMRKILVNELCSQLDWSERYAQGIVDNWEEVEEIMGGIYDV